MAIVITKTDIYNQLTITPQKIQFLPLREINLHSRPLVKRGIALSCDGELAVAADDSVHVFVPEFPDLPRQLQDRIARRLLRKKQREDLRRMINGHGHGQGDPPGLNTPKGAGANGSATGGKASGGEEKGNVEGNGDEGGPDKMDVDHPREADIEQHDKGNEEDDDDDDEKDEPPINLRAQYSEGSRHMPVSYPPLDPRMNRELFYNLGLEFPYDKTRGDDGDGEEDDDEDDEDEDGGASKKRSKKNIGAGERRKGSRPSSVGADEEDEEDDDEDDDEDEDGDEIVNEDGEVISGRSNIPNRPFGAGYGPITGVGSSMNHVVCLNWSPSGLGVNRRPVLAVLTGSGTLAMYGDGNTAGNILPRANEGMLQHRELASWEVLWGVGERLFVPGQQDEVAENLRGFAWAKEIAPGQALLATVNDLLEVAILSVQTVYRADGEETADENGKGAGLGERLVWLVQEVVRFEAKGPHPKGDVTDPDWTPFGTSFGLNWTRWHRTETSMTCLMSFIDRNYVGFRKLTVKTPWVRGELPEIVVDTQDIFGKCLHMATDAFVEFEDAIWSYEKSKKVRGVVVTGWSAMPFEIAMDGGTSYSHQPHSPDECGTLYPDDQDAGLQNTICDLVIHPPDPAHPTPTPIYTLVRTSATVKTHDWYETNVDYAAEVMTDGGRSEEYDTRPQWARDIQQKIDISVPVNMQLKHGFEGDSDSEEDEDESESEAELDDDEDGYDDEGEEGTENGENTRPSIPEINPHRYRLHGLTCSPAGGMTAILASHHSTQHPERGGWHTVRSTVMFGYKPIRRPQPSHTARQPNGTILNNDVEIAPLTTEGKLFEWLYGGGPPVAGVHFPRGGTSPDQNLLQPATEPNRTATAAEQRKAQIKALFQPALDAQKCDLCGTRMTENKRGSLSGCEKGHYFGTCATSGLAVQMPGITRSCGACGLRTIRTEVLVGKMPPEMRDQVVRAVGEGVCGGCGGKFLT